MANDLRVFTYTTSRKVEKVIVNIDNISNIVQDGDDNCLIYFAGDKTDCIRVDGNIEDMYFQIVGLRS